MNHFIPVLASSEPGSSLSKKLAWVRRVSLAVVFLIAVTTLAAWITPALGRILPDGWQSMKIETAFTALFSAISLWLSESWQTRRTRRLGRLFGGLVTLLALTVYIEFAFHLSIRIDSLPPFNHVSPSLMPARMSMQAAGAFALLGFELLFIRARTRFAVHLADLILFCLGVLVLTLLSGYLFGAMRIFGLFASIQTAPQSLVCLLLLTLVILVRRTKNGVFSILLGRGIGGKIARLISPILLVLPFLRETVRVYLITTGRIPIHYTSAILASLAAMLSFALLLFICWRINGMEMEIRDLSLRDELTGLYNLRGFTLLAEQALRMAQRSRLPFSVLFIDLDNLKRINDSIGHSEGSVYLVETAQILKATFRESDVLGRIGGDEFAVASQFNNAAISLATERLREALRLRNSQAGHKHTLSMSIGHVTSQENEQNSLAEMLMKADKAMYEEKRRKKLRDAYSSI
jgi:diguanylate cyclase (GGDEF)-like protein